MSLEEGPVVLQPSMLSVCYFRVSKVCGVPDTCSRCHELPHAIPAMMDCVFANDEPK